MEYIDKPPSPSGTLEALKALGYTLKTALADLLDNSITAEAKNIWINFFWDGEDSHITILDDGKGMTEEMLDNAMTPGFQNPNDPRDKSDLGRFSLGLKTASWSQSHKLSVWSKSNEEPSLISSMGWDIDHVLQTNKWICQKNLDAPNELEQLIKIKSGTLVKWEKFHTPLFLSSSQSQEALDEFNLNIRSVEKYLGMIFHRFIEGKVKYNKNNGSLNIFINNNLIRAWNPFHASSKVIPITTPTDEINCAQSIIEIKGYILPHQEHLSANEIEEGGGPNGWLQQQGFYVYRGDRLLVAGDWLGLRSYSGRLWGKDEQYKLARISIDIPNTLDKTWQIDLKKTTATPPHFLVAILTRQADLIREEAKKSFVHRGEYGPRARVDHYIEQKVWEHTKRNNNLVYKVNKKHPLIRGFYDKLGVMSVDLDSFITLIEECVPVQQIWLDVAEDEKEPVTPYSGLDKELEKTIKQLFLILKKKMTPSEAIAEIKRTQPFNRFGELIEGIVKNI
jgi:hypothetical protein